MEQKKIETEEEVPNEAIELYEKGEWKKAIEILEAEIGRTLDNRYWAKLQMHIGWNNWKLGNKIEAVRRWEMSYVTGSDNITQASMHAGLGIYYAEKDDKEKALYHTNLAQKLPKNATMNQNMNLNACGIALAKIGELKKAEEVLRKVMQINEQLEKSDNPVIAQKAKHQLAKNGYNLVSLIYLPQGRWDESIRELYEEVIPRYTAVGAETDLAAAYHRMAEAYEKMAETGDIDSKTEELEMALAYEKVSLNFWQKHPDDLKRVETAGKNITNIINKIENLKH